MSFSTVTVAQFCFIILVLAETNFVFCKEISRSQISHQSDTFLNRVRRSPRQVGKLKYYHFQIFIFFQLKLCGNQLINMLGIICRVYNSRDGNLVALFWKGIFGFLGYIIRGVPKLMRRTNFTLMNFFFLGHLVSML